MSDQLKVYFFRPAGEMPLDCEVKVLTEVFGGTQGHVYKGIFASRHFDAMLVIEAPEEHAQKYVAEGNEKLKSHSAHNPNMSKRRFEARPNVRLN